MTRRCSAVSTATGEQCKRRAVRAIGRLAFCAQHSIEVSDSSDPFHGYPDMIDPETGEIRHGGRMIAKYIGDGTWTELPT